MLLSDSFCGSLQLALLTAPLLNHQPEEMVRIGLEFGRLCGWQSRIRLGRAEGVHGTTGVPHPLQIAPLR